MEIGDHLVSPRTGYLHHGLYIGNDNVIHYAGFENIFDLDTSVQEVDLNEFDQDMGYEIVPHPNRRYSGSESVTRARERLGENLYNLGFNNCEHFVNWCIEGKHRSKQVEAIMSTGVLGHMVSMANESPESGREAVKELLTPPIVKLVKKLFD